MKYIDEFRDQELVNKLVSAIRKISTKKVRIMEVCGGHTLAIRKFGIPALLPDTIELLSGPGCPVCVTDQTSINKAIAFARLKDVIITTYGDLIRVPGSTTNLNQEKATGADVRIVYSTMDALKIAADNPAKSVVFLGIGFETTTPSSAVAILEADRMKIKNFYLMSMHKLMPPAMAALIDQGVQIDGYIGPGHVTTVAGSQMYRPLLEKYNISVVISGFEPIDVLQSIYMLVRMKEENRHGIEIQYKRVVSLEGNLKAREAIDRVFLPCDTPWRGLGLIPNSGLAIRDEYKNYDAEARFTLKVEPAVEPKGCICSQVLRGLKRPDSCGLFGKTCTPVNPVGACMVSGEGACQAYYRYGSSMPRP